MHALKLMQIGDATGLILPPELLVQMQAEAGATVFLIETPEGILLTTYEPAIVAQLEAGHQFMREFQASLRGLSV